MKVDEEKVKGGVVSEDVWGFHLVSGEVEKGCCEGSRWFLMSKAGESGRFPI